jgi:hypothetical protein
MKGYSFYYCLFDWIFISEVNEIKAKYEKVIEMLKKENENSLKNLLEEGY